MKADIHSSSVIEEGAIIGEDVTIGPFCHIGCNVELGDGAKLHSHVAITGHTKVGKSAKIFPFASVGHAPQDLKFQDEKTFLEIGDNCIIREGVTLNPGTAQDAGITKIGDNCVFLANSHVAHDCIIGNGVIFSNAVMLAGHCHVGDHTIFGGGAGVHQFTRIGRNAFVGGMAGVEADVIPFGMALGNRAYLGGLNLVGMKRAGMERAEIHMVRRLFKDLFSGDKPVREIALNIRDSENDTAKSAAGSVILNFILERTDRSLCTPQ